MYLVGIRDEVEFAYSFGWSVALPSELPEQSMDRLNHRFNTKLAAARIRLPMSQSN